MLPHFAVHTATTPPCIPAAVADFLQPQQQIPVIPRPELLVSQIWEVTGYAVRDALAPHTRDLSIDQRVFSAPLDGAGAGGVLRAGGSRHLVVDGVYDIMMICTTVPQ